MRVAASNLLQQGTGLMTEPWVFIEDVSKHLGVVEKNIYRWLKARDFRRRDPSSAWFGDLLMGLPIDRRRAHPIWQILETQRPILMELTAEMLASFAQTDEHRRGLETLRPRSIMGVPRVKRPLTDGECPDHSRRPPRRGTNGCSPLSKRASPHPCAWRPRTGPSRTRTRAR